MSAPRTYRLRFTAYIAVLLAFLVGVLVLTYRSSSELVLREAETSLARVTQQLTGQIENEHADLAERVNMVRDSRNFQEYLFIAISLNTDPEALREQYRRQFGWLQIKRSVVLSKSSRIYVGPEHRDLARALMARGLHRSSKAELFYLNGPHGLEMVATAPIFYRSQHLGVVALTKILDAEWMASVRQITGGELFFVRDAKIAMSTLGPAAAGGDFLPASDRLTFGRDTFLVRRLVLCNDPEVCHFYLALSQTELTSRIAAQRNRVLVFAAIGCLAVLTIGFMMLRNFGLPVSRLAAMIGEVSQGRFPDFPRMPARDEIGFLWNQFAEMVRSLRDKQEELAAVHRQLEKQAVTDELTGLYNRRHLYDIYPKLWSEALRKHARLSVILIDLDHFKQVNDRFGHLVGDKVIVHLADILRECCRMSDFLFRMGGEEFLVLTHGDAEGAQALAGKIREALESKPINDGQFIIRVTASFGVAQAEETDGLNGLVQTLARADKALYAAKDAGRNRVACWQVPRLLVSRG